MEPTAPRPRLTRPDVSPRQRTPVALPDEEARGPGAPADDDGSAAGGPPDGWDRGDRRSRAGRALAAAAALAVLAWWLAAGSPAGVRSDSTADADPDEVQIERSADLAPRDLPRVGTPPWRPPTPGAWAVLPEAPVGSRIGHVVADLDSGGDGVSVVVWGGYQSGRPLDTAALFDVTAGRWFRIANSPDVEDGHAGVAAGALLVLLHQSTPMVYEADRDLWRRLPAPPLDEGLQVTGITAFTGRLAVTLTATDRGDPGPTLAYDVVTNTWSLLPAPPGPLSRDDDLVWDGADLLLLGTDDPFGHRLDFGTANVAPVGGWEPLPEPPVPADVLDTASVRAVATGSVRADDPVYVWLGPRPGSASLPRLLRFDAGAQTFGPDRPDRPDGADGDRWQEVAAPTLSEPLPELFWTGDELLVVGISGVGAFAPSRGTFATLPDAAVASGQLREAAWTGSHLLWWGGDAGDGAVWRPVHASDVRDVVARPDRLGHPCAHVPWDACGYRTER